MKKMFAAAALLALSHAPARALESAAGAQPYLQTAAVIRLEPALSLPKIPAERGWKDPCEPGPLATDQMMRPDPCDPEPRPFPDPKPRPWDDDYRRPRRGWDDAPGFHAAVDGVKKDLSRGEIGSASSSLASVFDGLLKRAGGEAAGAVRGFSPAKPSFLTGPFSTPNGKLRGASVPAPYTGGARIVTVSDANPIRNDNAQMGAGIWGAAGAFGGATAGPIGAAVGGAAGAIAGAVSGHIEDLKEKAARDEQTYQQGTAAANRDHHR